MPRADLVEARCRIGDDPREDVEAARRALGVRAAPHALWKRQRLEERHEIDRPALQRRARLQRHPIDDQVALGEVARLESALDRLPERQEARAELIRARTEPEVEAGGLVLVVSDRPLGADPPVADGGAELMVWQDAVGHGAQPITRLPPPAPPTPNPPPAPAAPPRPGPAPP